MSNTIKYKLEEFAASDESILIGIVSSSPDYTVCWHINKQLQIDLSRVNDLKFEHIKKNKKTFELDLFSEQNKPIDSEENFSKHHVFKFLDEQLYSEYFFIANKGTLATLDPQLKKVSYFLEVCGTKSENAEQIVFDLNTIEPIQMAYLIGKESIINKLQLLI
jgi:hypothetical protein